MRIVLDTNVLVSGLLNPYGAPGQIVQMVAGGKLLLCYDARILGEYGDVLLRPTFGFDPRHVARFVDQIQADGMLVTTSPLPNRLPDPDDEPFLEAAIAGAAECLITGNLRHYPATACGPIRVLAPGDFLDVLRQRAAP